jgi:hypothetical protein
MQISQVFDRKIHTLGKWRIFIININRVQNFAIFAGCTRTCTYMYSDTACYYDPQFVGISLKSSKVLHLLGY